jgi:hypothetical protein
MEMAALEQAQLREEQELVQLQKDLGLNSGGGGGGGGHQSEPTTPPEYHQQDASSVNGGGGGGGGFSSFVSRPNRYSTSSIMSPTGMFSTGLPNGNTLSAAHLDALARTRMALDDQLPPQQYDDEDDDDKEIAVRQDPTSHRSTNQYVFGDFFVGKMFLQWGCVRRRWGGVERGLPMPTACGLCHDGNPLQPTFDRAALGRPVGSLCLIAPEVPALCLSRGLPMAAVICAGS